MSEPFDPFRPQDFNVDLRAPEAADDQRDMRGAAPVALGYEARPQEITPDAALYPRVRFGVARWDDLT